MSDEAVSTPDRDAQIASLQGHYNGLGVKVDKRAGDVNLVSSYTYSHKLDNWAASRAKFVKVFPTEYKRALAELAAAAQSKKEKVAA